MEIKIAIVVVLVSVANLFGVKTYCQHAKVTLEMENTTLEQIMDEIERQSEFYFIFNQKQIDVDRSVNVQLDNKLIDEILSDIFNGTTIKFTVLDRKILLEENGIIPVSDQQGISVSGTITDANTGDAMPGVNVLVKGTTLGTLTDVNGKYSIVVPDKNAVLVFSFIGYSTIELPIAGKTYIDATLESELTVLEEVMVVGYGTQKKESVVGAITQVGSERLMKSGTTNITTAISGKLSGVLTIQQSGEPGANAAEIIIRGLSSWNSSEPLVLVDGVERDFSSIDPNEVDAISVLKDASATAVFGARGANGVIIVTTKRGTLGRPQFDVSVMYGLAKATSLAETVDSYTTMKALNVARMDGMRYQELLTNDILEEYRNPSTPLNSIIYPNVDWFERCTNTFAPMANANLNVRGGTEFVKYFFSLGYQHQGDFFKRTKDGFIDNRFYDNRYNYRINLDFSISKSTQLSLNVGGDVSIKNQPSSISWHNLYYTSPARFPAYYPEWVLDLVPDRDYPDATGDRLVSPWGEYYGNPYTTLMSPGFNRYLGSTLFTDLILNQKLDNILKGLSINGKVSLSTYYNSRNLYLSYSYPSYQLRPEYIGVDKNEDGIVDTNPWLRGGEGNEVWYPAPIDINVGGLNDGYYKFLYYEASLNYSNTFGKHTVTGLALFNRQQKNIDVDFPYYNEGLVGRTTYDYDHKYLLELNVGYTGSERFAPTNRFGFFPSVAIGWVVSEEQFFNNALPWMNKFKIRYSDGMVGSDYAANRWLYASSYYVGKTGYIHEDLAPNTTAQWEMAHKRDLGFEIGVFNNAFTLSVDLFDEFRNKMLLTPKTVTMFVANSFKELNIGEVKKHGIEIEAEFRKSPSPNFEYFIRGLFGFNENRIVFKDDPVNTPEHQKHEGKPLTSAWYYGSDGLELNGISLAGSGYYTSVDDIHNNGSPIDLTKLYIGDYKFLDYDGNGKINTIDKHFTKGLTYPPISYSLTSGFTYKNFDFHFLFLGNAGKYTWFSLGFEKEFQKGDWCIRPSQLDYWTPTNPDAGHSRLHYTAGGTCDILAWGGGDEDKGFQILIDDRSFRNSSYLRLKDVYASYTFNSALLNKLIGVSKFLVYATADNILTFTKLIEGDPERKDFSFNGYYPIMTNAKLGIKVVF